MILMAVSCLGAGILVGCLLSTDWLSAMDLWTRVALYASVFFAGIQIGLDKSVLGQVKAMGAKVLLVPLGVITGSVAAGLITGPLLRMPLGEAAAVTAGMGWYSLSAVLLRDLGGGRLGTTAFLANIFREVGALLITAGVAKIVGKYPAIAPAGATAMDSCLPTVTKATDQATAVVALISGVVCTGMVPFLVPLLYGIFS